jgi:hypothetical protein
VFGSGHAGGPAVAPGARDPFLVVLSWVVLSEPPRVWWRVGYPASCCYTGVI